MSTAAQVIKAWAERSGSAMHSGYMNGHNTPRGLDPESAAVVLRLAFPDELRDETIKSIVRKLEMATDVVAERLHRNALRAIR